MIVEWLSLTNDQIKNDVGADGVRLLHYFFDDYFAVFNVDARKTIVGCGKCVDKTINQLKDYLRAKKSTVMNQKAFLTLNRSYSPYKVTCKKTGEVKTFYRETLTNEDIAFIFENVFSAAWVFEDFVEKFYNKHRDANKAVQDAKNYFSKFLVKEDISKDKHESEKIKNVEDAEENIVSEEYKDDEFNVKEVKKGRPKKDKL